MLPAMAEVLGMRKGPGFFSPGCLSTIISFIGVTIAVWIVGAIAVNIVILTFGLKEPGQIASLITFLVAIVVAVIKTRKMLW